MQKSVKTLDPNTPVGCSCTVLGDCLISLSDVLSKGNLDDLHTSQPEKYFELVKCDFGGCMQYLTIIRNQATRRLGKMDDNSLKLLTAINMIVEVAEKSIDRIWRYNRDSTM